MDLLNFASDEMPNKLPYDGCVYDYGPILSLDDADGTYKCLMKTIDWRHDEAVIYGKRIVTKRKVAWYADKPFSNTYSNVTKTAQLWTPELVEIKSKVEHIISETFNSCLLNLYHDGSESMAWHSDAETELKKNGVIASLSLGAIRKFAFKHKQTKDTVSMMLDHGSLITMQGRTQTNWLHRLPPTTKVKTPRINLTFRQMNEV